jgi:hypothetical protein
LNRDFVEKHLLSSIEELNIPNDPGNEEFIEHRMFMKENILLIDENQKHYEPFEYDMNKFINKFRRGTS